MKVLNKQIVVAVIFICFVITMGIFGYLYLVGILESGRLDGDTAMLGIMSLIVYPIIPLYFILLAISKIERGKLNDSSCL